MARLWHSGAESAAIHAEGITTSGTGTLSFDTGTVRTGTYSLKYDSGAGNLDVRSVRSFTGAVGTTYYTSQWVYIPTASGLPTATAQLVVAAGGSVRMNTSGNLQLFVGAAQVGSNSTALSTNTWHRIDFAYRIDVGNTDYYELRLNGSSVATTSAGSFTDTAPGNHQWGWAGAAAPGASKVIYFDDIVIQDSSGSVNTSWPGQEKVVLLLPISDNARVGWAAGAGGTSNLWDALNNTPPTGVAVASATDTSQIKDANNNATDTYDANLKAYATAGIQGADTITAVFGVWEAGSDSTTGTDTINGSLVSNPAISEASSSVDIVTGTYATGWNRGVTTITEYPGAIDVVTSPVMRVRKSVATTRTHQVTLMGLQVAYIPDTAKSPPPVRFSRVQLRR